MNRMSWMKENAYVTYTKHKSEDKDKANQLGWKIKSLKNNVLCLAELPELGKRPEINIDLNQPFEFNTLKGTDSERNQHIVEYWINPQAKVGELVQVWKKKLHPIEQEEIITIKIGGYRRACMIVRWEKSRYYRIVFPVL